jgi:hypothetical protein
MTNQHRPTHINRDAPQASRRRRLAQAGFVLVRHQVSKHGIDVKRVFIRRQTVHAEPQTRHPVRRVQMDLVRNAAHIDASVGVGVRLWFLDQSLGHALRTTIVMTQF